MGLLGNLLRPKNDPNERTPPGMPMPFSALGAAGDLGNLATPASNEPVEPPPQNEEEFNQRVARNEGFLSSPEVQAGLLQFALTIMQPGASFGAAASHGLAASGRVRTIAEEKTEKEKKEALANKELSLREKGLSLDERQLEQSITQSDRDAALREKGFGLDAKRLGLDEQKLLLEKRQADDLLIQQNRRQELLGKLSGGEQLADLPEDDLLDIAGELAAAGDNDGAKIALDIAEEKRLSTPGGSNVSDAFNNWIAAKAAGDPDALNNHFSKWDRMQRESGVPKPPLATSNLSPAMEGLAIDLGSKADLQEQNIMDMEILRDTAMQSDTGKLVPLTLPIRQAFAEFGITFGDDVTQIPLLETMMAQQNQLAMKIRNPASGGGLPGSASDRDVKFLVASGPSISNTPEANQAIAIIMLGKARMTARLTRMKEQFILENGTTKGWLKARDAYLEDPETTMFMPEEQQFLDRLANPERPPVGKPSVEPKNTEVAPMEVPDLSHITDETKRKRIENAWPHLSPEARKAYSR